MNVDQLGQWWEMASEQWGIELGRIPVVILSAAGIYIAFMLLAKIFGSRILSSMTATDAVVVIMFGAVAGRVIIGHPPSLVAGIIGLTTLMVLEAVFGAIRKNTHIDRLFDRAPVLVLAHGKPLPELMKKTHVSMHDLNTVARRTGVGSLGDLAAVVIEPTGAFTAIKTGQQLDPEVFDIVIGADEHLFY